MWKYILQIPLKSRSILAYGICHAPDGDVTVKELLASGVVFSSPVSEIETDSPLDTVVLVCPTDGFNPPMATVSRLVSVILSWASIAPGEPHPASSRTISIRSRDVKGAPAVCNSTIVYRHYRGALIPRVCNAEIVFFSILPADIHSVEIDWGWRSRGDTPRYLLY
jgi:hypothetical protein